MGIANAAICPSPPYIYLSPSSALVILLSHIDTHKYSVSLCASVFLSVILSSNTKPLSPATVLLTQSFQTQWGRVG